MSEQSGQVTAISGGAGGAGLTITRMLAARGDRVFVIDRAEQRGRVDGLNDERITFVAADAFDEASVAAAIGQVVSVAGGLGALVNAVGGYRAGQPVHELDAADWDAMMQLNLRAAFLLTKHAARAMLPAGRGHILHFAARAARDTAANAGAYAVSKAGVVALVGVQAKELVAHGITVNCILPSVIDTPANRAAMPHADFARWPKAEEIGRVVLFLTADDSGLISGAAIPVYGRG